MTHLATEREAFEAWYAKRHPVPTHENSTWAHCAKMDDWEVWQARAGAAPAAVAPQGEYPHEQMDAMALARYKVVPSHASMLWSHAVVAGDGVQQLYVGREAECQNMARKFAGAFLDGAFAFHSMAAAPTTQAAPALEAPSAYNSAGPIKRYMLDCNIDGMDQFREFILATDHDTLVHDVLANADPAGTVQENGLLRDQVRQLDAMVGRMKREAAAPQAPAQEAPAAPVRQVLTDAQITHLQETRVGEPSPSRPIDASDWMNFARAIEAASLAALAKCDPAWQQGQRELLQYVARRACDSALPVDVVRATHAAMPDELAARLRKAAATLAVRHSSYSNISIAWPDEKLLKSAEGRYHQALADLDALISAIPTETKQTADRDQLDSLARKKLGALLNAFGEAQWQAGRGVPCPSIEDAFEAVISAAVALLAAAPQAPAAPSGEVISANCEFATVRWLHQTSGKGGGDPKNSYSWPIKVFLAASAAPSTHAGLLAAAAHIQAKAQAHLDERGSYDPDTGAVEMSDANQEHFNTLDELADEIRMMADKAAPASCDRPPAGWTCTRAPGHDGPCAAAPAAPAVDAETIHLQDLKNALAECQELRQQLTLMDEQQAGSIWRWQADDQDQIETMGNRMGVLIYACDLRALLARAAPAVDAKAHDWRENASYGGEICAECGAAKGSRRGNAPCAWPPEPLDVCTDPYNCARCKTHPAHRGDMHHAGISRIGGSA